MKYKEELAIIEYNPFHIEKIKDPSERIQLKAIESNYFTIRCIKKPTEKVQQRAVSHNRSVIKYINHPYDSVLNMIDPKYHVAPKNITPDFEYAFYEPVYTTMEQIMYDFSCYINEKVKFFQYKTLKGAMNYLLKQKTWRFENGSRACEIDIRKIKSPYFYNLSQDSFFENYLKYYKLDKEFTHGEEIDGNYILPLVCDVEFCPDGHADYLVFEYENELYLVTILCYE